MAAVKVNQDKMTEASVLGSELSNINVMFFEWQIRARKLLDRRNQRFERSISAMENKFFLLFEIWHGLTITGELPKFHSAEESKW